MVPTAIVGLLLAVVQVTTRWTTGTTGTVTVRTIIVSELRHYQQDLFSQHLHLTVTNALTSAVLGSTRRDVAKHLLPGSRPGKSGTLTLPKDKVPSKK